MATSIENAESLLQSVEAASNEVGLQLNEGKTKTLPLYFNPSEYVKTRNGTSLENVHQFKYLGSYIPDSFQDFKSRKAQAWSACNKLCKIWKSDLERSLKINIFRACVESILLYGSETWTITKKMEARIDGCYTQLLRRVLNISWRYRIPNKVVYGKLPPISLTIKQRRLRFAGHCARSSSQPISKLIFWTPTSGSLRRGRKPLNYPDTICNDLGLEKTEIANLMQDRELWAAHVASFIPSTDDR